jgi:hypothetical protein
LCHAVYGTDGYPVRLLDPGGERDELARLIGAAAESLVYLYASCDRGYLYPLIRAAAPLRFRDRFNGQEFTPDRAQFGAFMELTFANELDIFGRDPALVADHQASFGTLFRRSQALVSGAAYDRFVAVFGGSDSAAAQVS